VEATVATLYINRIINIINDMIMINIYVNVDVGWRFFVFVGVTLMSDFIRLVWTGGLIQVSCDSVDARLDT
jgi:hypothetical protein